MYRWHNYGCVSSLLLVVIFALCHWLGIFTYDTCLCEYYVITDIFMSMLWPVISVHSPSDDFMSLVVCDCH